jgi:hypothetical protein
MATTYKVLGQVATSVLGATTEGTLYSPSGAQAVVSTIAVCNQAGTSATYRIAVRKTGESTTVNKNWIVYGATVAASDTVLLTIGATLEDGAAIRVYGSSATMSFTAFGSEIA